MSTDKTTTAWIVVKQWPGGKIEPVAGYTDEQKARHAAGQLIGREECWVVLWTVEMHDERKPNHRMAADRNSPAGP